MFLPWFMLGFLGALYWLLKKKSSLLSKWWVTLILFLLFGIFIAQTIVGGWIGSMMRSISGWMGMSVGAVAGAILVLALVTIYLDCRHDKKADALAKISVVLLPLLFVFAAGPIAPTGRNLTDALSNLFTHGFTAVTGA